ncbi:MAG: putative zinc-finger [Actinomycetota bacterium]|nr:putative zinc-finger [Actinomycetota bacterium]MEA2971974.1 putative zinc-finger [Actinomycetota bacterium]
MTPGTGEGAGAGAGAAVPGDGHAGDSLSALLDGELSPAEESAVQAHLVTCLACRHEMETIGLARQWLRALPPVEPPFGLYERMLVPYRPGRRRVAMAFLGAAAAVAAVLVSVAPAPPPAVDPNVATLIEAHATSAVEGDALTNLAPAGVPVSINP